MTETRSNAELSRAYVDDAMRANGDLTGAYGRDAVLTAANVLAVLATADAMRPQQPVVMVNAGNTPMSETGRLVLQRQLDQARATDLPEHEIKVGDPDPTPNKGEHCGNRHKLGRTCTCRPGHTPPHVSGNGLQVVAVWA